MGLELLVTAFSSFHAVARNPTERLVEYLRSQEPKHLIDGIDRLSLRVLKVAASAADAFADAFAETLLAAESENDAENATPLIVVHLGVDAGCRTPDIKLERCAYNECGFRCPDEDGVVLHFDHAPDQATPLGARLETDVDVARLKARIEAKRDARQQQRGEDSSYRVRLSDDAGRFLCNYVYARTLSACQRRQQQQGCGRRRPQADCLFVHVPPFSVLREEVQREALLDLLSALVEQYSSSSS